MEPNREKALEGLEAYLRVDDEISNYTYTLGAKGSPIDKKKETEYLANLDDLARIGGILEELGYIVENRKLLRLIR